MSSVKRRKLDGSVPSGLAKHKEPAASTAKSRASTSTSPEHSTDNAEPESQGVEVATKTFQDLVWSIYSQIYNGELIANGYRVLSTRYAMHAPP